MIQKKMLGKGELNSVYNIINVCIFSIAGIASNVVSIVSTFIAIYNESTGKIKCVLYKKVYKKKRRSKYAKYN